jgi:hypothetical protein
MVSGCVAWIQFNGSAEFLPATIQVPVEAIQRKERIKHLYAAVKSTGTRRRRSHPLQVGDDSDDLRERSAGRHYADIAHSLKIISQDKQWSQRLPYFVMGDANADDICSVTFKHHKLKDSRSFNLYDQRRITA